MAESAGQLAKEVAQDAGGQVLGAVGMAKRSDTDKEAGQNKVQGQEQGQGQDGTAKHSLNDQAHAEAAQGLSELLEGDNEGEHVVTRGQVQQAEEIARSAALEAIESLSQNGTSHQKLVARELQEEGSDANAEGQDKAQGDDEAGSERSQGTEQASTQAPARSQKLVEEQSLSSKEEGTKAADDATPSQLSGHGMGQGDEREVSRCPDKGHVEALKSQFTENQSTEGMEEPAHQERPGGEHVKVLQDELQEKVKGGDHEQAGSSNRVRDENVLHEGRVGAVTEAIERQTVASGEENVQSQERDEKDEEHHSEHVQALKAELQKQVDGVDKEDEGPIRKELSVKIEEGKVEAVKSNLQKAADSSHVQSAQAIKSEPGRERVGDLKSKLRDQVEESEGAHTEKPAVGKLDREVIENLEEKLKELESPSTGGAHTTEKPPVGKLDKEVIQDLEEKLGDLALPPEQDDANTEKKATVGRGQEVEGGEEKNTVSKGQKESLPSQLAAEGKQASAGAGGDEKRQKVGEQEESPALKEALGGLQTTREEKDDLTKVLEEAKGNGASVTDKKEADKPATDAPKEEGDVKELEKLGEENEKGQAKIEEAEKKMEAKAVIKDAPAKGTPVKESSNKAAVQKGA